MNMVLIEHSLHTISHDLESYLFFFDCLQTNISGHWLLADQIFTLLVVHRSFSSCNHNCYV